MKILKVINYSTALNIRYSNGKFLLLCFIVNRRILSFIVQRKITFILFTVDTVFSATLFITVNKASCSTDSRKYIPLVSEKSLRPPLGDRR